LNFFRGIAKRLLLYVILGDPLANVSRLFNIPGLQLQKVFNNVLQKARGHWQPPKKFLRYYIGIPLTK
jgi:hypothetical protein